MNWQEILLSVVSIVLTALISWLTQRLIVWINSKIANSKYAKYLTEIVDIVSRAVKATYQTYVQSLKDKNMFTKDAQLFALQQAKDMILAQLSQGAKKYIENNFGDLEQWLNSMIESTIYELKNQNNFSEVIVDENN